VTVWHARAVRPGDGAIRYLCPDHPEPSWGVGMLYTHVAILARHGFDAAVVHADPGFRPPWLEVEAPVAPVGMGRLDPRPADLVVVPEVLAARPEVTALGGRKALFVQGAYTLLPLLRSGRGVRDAYVAAAAVLPSVAEVVERFLGIPAAVVPPAVARAFFAEGNACRERRILLVPPKLRLADAEILDALLERRLPAGWEVTRLAGLTHGEVADLMRRSTFLVNLNVGEAFNTTVPEAMAAGCVVLCYEAWGGRDFLGHRDNAYVFPNFYVYPLAETLLRLTGEPERAAEELEGIRARARATARRFTEEATAAALLAFVDRL